jgi:hypothetical protein
LIKGVYEITGDTSIRISELPIGTGTMPYITILEELMDGGVDKKGKKDRTVYNWICVQFNRKNRRYYDKYV